MGWERNASDGDQTLDVMTPIVASYCVIPGMDRRREDLSADDCDP
jgi:hypothetical protein